MQSGDKPPVSIFYSNTHKYIEYIPGTLNVILSVPHGGNLRPSQIPNRDFGILAADGKPVFDHKPKAKEPRVPVRTKGDRFTIQLALNLADVLFEKTGRYPHVVINRLHRQKLDCNCECAEAAFNVQRAVDAWDAYHRFIDIAKHSIGGDGLFIDIHGHSHPESWIELGYTLPGSKLDAGNYQAEDTTIRHLHRRLENSTGNSVDIRELVTGPKSLGGLISSSDPSYADLVVPSPSHPGPQQGKFFSGGYNVARHGSKFRGTIDAIQIESPIDKRMPSVRLAYAAVLGEAIAEFLRIYYNGDDNSAGDCPV